MVSSMRKKTSYEAPEHVVLCNVAVVPDAQDPIIVSPLALPPGITPPDRHLAYYGLTSLKPDIAAARTGIMHHEGLRAYRVQLRVQTGPYTSGSISEETIGKTGFLCAHRIFRSLDKALRADFGLQEYPTFSDAVRSNPYLLEQVWVRYPHIKVIVWSSPVVAWPEQTATPDDRLVAAIRSPDDVEEVIGECKMAKHVLAPTSERMRA